MNLSLSSLKSFGVRGGVIVLADWIGIDDLPLEWRVDSRTQLCSVVVGFRHSSRIEVNLNSFIRVSRLTSCYPQHSSEPAQPSQIARAREPECAVESESDECCHVVERSSNRRSWLNCSCARLVSHHVEKCQPEMWRISLQTHFGRWAGDISGFAVASAWCCRSSIIRMVWHCETGELRRRDGEGKKWVWRL